MKSFLKRSACFFALFALLVLFAAIFLHKMDAVSSMTLEEMKARSDIELCLVGSSTARNHFNPARITELTGKRAFNAAIMGASLQADIAIIEELLRTNSPRYIALVVDAYNFDTAKEDSLTEAILMPHLSTGATRLRYYLNLCREDGAYIDRLLLFRMNGEFSPARVIRNIGLRFRTAKTFARLGDDVTPGARYMGEGYLRSTLSEPPDRQVRQLCIATGERYPYPLMDGSVRMLREIMALCEDAGAQLLIVITPNLTAHMLAERDLLPYTDSLIAFCRENALPLLNLAYARPELMPCLDPYYTDFYHLGGEGSDILTDAFARLFSLYLAGEDTQALCYPNSDAYLSAIDWITNVWLTCDAQTFTAECNRGSQVTPLYRYVLLARDGAETLLRDFDPDPSFTYDLPKDTVLRVYAKPAGNASAASVYYDYPTDYIVSFGP